MSTGIGAGIGIELATDKQFQELSNFAQPPRAGKVTAVLGSGQLTVDTDDVDGGDVTAWPLNGFAYAVDDIVYVAFAGNQSDSGIVLGSKSPLPLLDSAVLGAGYVKTDGSTALTAEWDIGEDMAIRAERFAARDGEGLRLEDDSGNAGLTIADGGAITLAGLASSWDIGAGRRILAEGLRARSSGGLRLEDDAGNLGLFVEDATGDVGVGTATPAVKLHVSGNLRIENTATVDLVGNGGASGDVPAGAALTTAAAALSLRAGATTPGTNSIGLYAYNGSAWRSMVEAANVASGNPFVRLVKTAGFVKIGSGGASPEGLLHAHDGTGGLIFVTKTGITNSAQTLIANAAGDVTGGLVGFYIANDGGGAVANSLTMLPGDNLDIVVGGLTLRLALNANGALTAIRQAGTGTATLILFAVWQ